MSEVPLYVVAPRPHGVSEWEEFLEWTWVHPDASSQVYLSLEGRVQPVLSRL